jgi:hypothetical protein
MAIEIKFKCLRNDKDYLVVNNINENVWIEGSYDGTIVEFAFDIQTAIKFAKTLRTEINKAKEGKNV